MQWEKNLGEARPGKLVTQLEKLPIAAGHFGLWSHAAGTPKGNMEATEWSGGLGLEDALDGFRVLACTEPSTNGMPGTSEEQSETLGRDTEHAVEGARDKRQTQWTKPAG